MTIELLDAHAQGLARFIGYGNSSAPIWFVGAEEGLGGKMSLNEQAANLRARCDWEPVEDMYDAHLTLREQGEPIDISSPTRRGHTGVWRWMSRISRAYEGAPDYANSQEAARYMRERLGRTSGGTFLTELRPFPQKTSNGSSRRALGDEQISRLLEERRTKQLDLSRNARIIICYGIGEKDRFAEHFEWCWNLQGSLPWVSSSGRQQQTELHSADFERDNGSSGRAFLLPFFGNGAMSAQLLEQFVDHRAFQDYR